jgi:hypothetical protein
LDNDFFKRRRVISISVHRYRLAAALLTPAGIGERGKAIEAKGEFIGVKPTPAGLTYIRGFIGEFSASQAERGKNKVDKPL